MDTNALRYPESPVLVTREEVRTLGITLAKLLVLCIWGVGLAIYKLGQWAGSYYYNHEQADDYCRVAVQEAALTAVSMGADILDTVSDALHATGTIIEHPITTPLTHLSEALDVLCAKVQDYLTDKVVALSTRHVQHPSLLRFFGPLRGQSWSRAVRMRNAYRTLLTNQCHKPKL